MGAMSKLEDYFRHSSDILSSRYEHSSQIEHGGTKGTLREIFMQNFLEDIYPNKYIFGDGEIIDSQGAISHQADVVIYDERFPVLEYGGSKHFLIEGVLAHIEVKSNISGSLDDALSKSESVKKLSIPQVPMPDTGGFDIVPDYWGMSTPGPSDTGPEDMPDVWSQDPQQQLIHSKIHSWIQELESNRFRKQMGEHFGKMGGIPPTTYSAVFAYEGPEPSTFKDNFMDFYDYDTDEEEVVNFVCVLGEYIMRYNSEEVVEFVETGEDSLLWFFVSLAQAFITKSMERPMLDGYLSEREYPTF